VRDRLGLVGTATAAVMLLGACAANTDRDSRGRDEIEPSVTTVTPETQVAIPVVPGATLTVSPGDFTEEATVSIALSDAPPVGFGWFTPVGDPVDIDVSSQPAAALELAWDGGPDAPLDAIPVVLRHDDTLGWYPVASAPQVGAPAEAGRTAFSPHAFGIIEDWADAIATGTRTALGDRSEPLTCSGPPEWVDFTVPAQDVVHACATTNVDQGTGVERVEVRLRNNRGIAVEVLIPDGAAYAWVDGQPDLLREGWRAVSGRDSVILPPGVTMSVGLTQPARSGITQITVTYSSLAILTTLLTQAAAADADTWYGILAVLSSCSPHPALMATAHDGVDALVEGAKVLLVCAQNLLTDEQATATLAAEFVAHVSGVDPATAVSDASMAPKIDKLAGNLRFLGGALATVSLSSKVLDAIADAYVYAKVGETNSLSPQVGMRAAPGAGNQGTGDAREIPLNPGEYAVFYTPTGEVVCSMIDSRVRCDVTDPIWTLPPRPQDCDEEWAHTASVGASGAPHIGGCVGDTIADAQPGMLGTDWFDPARDTTYFHPGIGEEMVALRPGSEITDGVIRCRATEAPDAGMQCSTVDIGTGFFVSAARAEAF
jgi:hypothetical protein